VRRDQLLQAGLQRSQIDSDLLEQRVLIDVTKILDMAAAIQLLQNRDTAGDGQTFLDGQLPSLPFIHNDQA
jgi:hypothetical protein